MNFKDRVLDQVWYQVDNKIEPKVKMVVNRQVLDQVNHKIFDTFEYQVQIWEVRDQMLENIKQKKLQIRKFLTKHKRKKIYK
jgi:hypothetical protein